MKRLLFYFLSLVILSGCASPTNTPEPKGLTVKFTQPDCGQPVQTDVYSFSTTDGENIRYVAVSLSNETQTEASATVYGNESIIAGSQIDANWIGTIQGTNGSNYQVVKNAGRVMWLLNATCTKGGE